MTAVAAWVVEGLLLNCSRGIMCIAFTTQGAETVDGHAAVLIVDGTVVSAQNVAADECFWALEAFKEAFFRVYDEASAKARLLLCAGAK